MLDVDVVQLPLELDDLLRLDLYVRGLALCPAGRLVDHDPGVGQRVPLARRPRRQDEAAHAARLADAPGADRGQDVSHGVVDGESGGDDPAGAVDVHVDGLLAALRLEEEELGHDQAGHVVVDGAHQADDALLEEAGVDVVAALAAAGLLHHHGHQEAATGRGGRWRRGGGGGAGDQEGLGAGGGGGQGECPAPGAHGPVQERASGHH